MIASATSLFLSAVFWTTAYASATDSLQPHLPLKQCHDEFSSVTVTSTRLQLNTALLTITLVDVQPTYVTVTTTDCEPYTVTQIEMVSDYAVPQLAFSTAYVTELHINEKKVVYTSTKYQPQTIRITYSATEVENLFTDTRAFTMSTAISTVTTEETLTSSVTETLTQIHTDTSTNFTYVPVYVTKTRTTEWPIYQTVYQEEYIKKHFDLVTTVTETCTVFHCSAGYLEAVFG